MKQEKDDSNKKAEPTRAELEILQILWTNGPSTVRFVNDKMNEHRVVGYTATLKVMQIMADKGILARDTGSMQHIYKPAEGEQQTKDHLVDRFVESVYQGSTEKLLLQVLGNKKTSKEDLARIREILDKLENKKG